MMYAVPIHASPRGPSFWYSELVGWCLALAGLWELFRAFPSQTFSSSYVSAAAVALGTGVLLLGLFMLGRQARDTRAAHSILRLIFLCLMAFAFKNGWKIDSMMQLAAVVAACLLWIYLSLPAASLAEPEAPQPRWLPLAFVALMTVGVFLRFHNLMNVPFGLNTDEVFNTERYKTYIDNGWHLFFTIHGHSMVAFHSLGFAMFHLLNVAGMHGVLAIRFGSAIWGVLGMLTFFLFIREVMGWRAAIWGLAFLCVSSFSILASREDVCDPAGIAQVSLIYYFYWKGLKGSRSWFLACGFATGLYMHGHYWQHFVLPATMVLFLAVSVAMKRLPLRALPLIGVLFFISFGLIYLNMWNYYRAELHTFLFDRVKQAQSGNGSVEGFSGFYRVLTSNFLKYIHFYVAPEGGNAVIYSPGRPLVDPWTAWLLLLGALGALASWAEKKLETLFFLVYFFLMLIPGSAAEYAPTVHRIANQIPVLFGLVGLGADRLMLLSGNRRAGGWNRVLGMLLILALGMSAAWNYKSFFVDFRNNYACHEYWGGVFGNIGELLRDAPKNTELVVSDAYASDYRSNVIDYEAAREFRWSDTSLASLFPVTSTVNCAALVVQEPSLELASGIFISLYPHALLRQVPDLSQGATVAHREPSPQGQKDLFCYYEIPAEDINVARGLSLQCKGSQKVVEGLGFSNSGLSDMNACGELTWQGALWVPKSQEYRLQGGLPQGINLSLDRKPLQVDKPVTLGKGFYPFQAEAPGPQVVPANLVLKGQDGMVLDLAQASTFRAAKFSNGLRSRYFGVATGMPMPDFSRIHSPDALERALKLKEALKLTRIEPTVFGRFTVCNYGRGMELPAPYDIIWDGHMNLPEAGDYNFFDEGRTPLDIWVDGKLFNNLGALRLSAGDHAIFVYHRLFRDANMFIAPVTLMVGRGGGKAELLPMSWLRAN